MVHGYEPPWHYEHPPPEMKYIRNAFWVFFTFDAAAFLLSAASFAAYPAGHPEKYVPKGPGTARSAMFW